MPAIRPLVKEDRTLATYKRLDDNIQEAAKHARSLFIAHIFLNTYGMVTVATMKDLDFYSHHRDITLPFVALDVSLVFYLPALALFSICVFMYFQFYLQHVWVLVGELENTEQFLDDSSDFVPGHRILRYPWIALIAEQPGQWNGLASHAFRLVSIGLTPLLLLFCCVRTERLGTSLQHWTESALPSSGPFIVLLVFTVFTCLVLHREYQLKTSGSEDHGMGIATWLVVGSIAVIGYVSIALASKTGLYLSYAEIAGQELAGIDLSRSRLHSADLRGAMLIRTDLRRADLSCANLRNVRLQLAQLQGARLEGARLEGAILEGARLDEATYDSSTVFPKGFSPSLARARASQYGTVCPRK